MELGFQHVGVYCRNIDESIAFYEDVFGCRLLFRSDAMEGDKPLKMAWIKGMGIVSNCWSARTNPRAMPPRTASTIWRCA